MNKKYIGLPKPYLSFSQVALWQRDQSAYAAHYFDGRDELRPSNSGMSYGKLVADALEKRVETGDLLTDAAMLMLPKYDIADEEFRVDLKTPKGWVTMLAKPDTMDSKTKNFGEFKTGKTPWTQKKAEGHLQMHWYATAIYLAHSVVPKAKLVWIETSQSTDGVVAPTGRIDQFDVNITLSDILKTMALVGKVADEIAIAWAAHVTDPRLVNF